MNKPLPLKDYIELLRRWLSSSDAFEREIVLVRVDEMAQQLLSSLVTQDELLSMHQEAQSLVVQGLRAEGGTFPPDGRGEQALLRLASGEALTLLVTLLLPLQIEQARRIQQAEEALRFNDMMRVTALASGVAHDFNNMLNAIVGLTELSLSDVPVDSELWGNLHGIARAARQGAAAVQDLHSFARSLPMRRLGLEMGTWLKGCQILLMASLPSHVALDLRIAADCHVLADPDRLEQVMVNLVKNAGYAMRRQGGQVQVILDRIHRPGATEWARLRVIDGGEGIPAEVLPHIFAPYFTTKPVGEGTGMGLSAAHGIIQQHEGTIEVDSMAGGPTVFTVLLPSI